METPFDRLWAGGDTETRGKRLTGGHGDAATRGKRLTGGHGDAATRRKTWNLKLGNWNVELGT